MYAVLADVIVTIHFSWILFLIFGVLIGRKVIWVMYFHIGSLAFSVILQINSWICPLTHLENWLRAKSGWAFTDTFIQHYVEKLVYLDVSRLAVLIGTSVVIGVTGVVYWKTICRNRRSQ